MHSTICAASTAKPGRRSCIRPGRQPRRQTHERAQHRPSLPKHTRRQTNARAGGRQYRSRSPREPCSAGACTASTANPASAASSWRGKHTRRQTHGRASASAGRHRHVSRAVYGHARHQQPSRRAQFAASEVNTQANTRAGGLQHRSLSQCKPSRHEHVRYQQPRPAAAAED